MVKLAGDDRGQVNYVRPRSIQLERGWTSGMGPRKWENKSGESVTDGLAPAGETVMGKFCIFFMQANYGSKFEIFFIIFFLLCLPEFSINVRYCNLIFIKRTKCKVLR